MKIYCELSFTEMKRLDLTTDIQNNLKILVKLKFFNFIIFNLTLIILILGISIFYLADTQIIFLLFYCGILLQIESLKYIIISSKMIKHLKNFLTNNSLDISDPGFLESSIIAMLYHAIRIIHYVILCTNYIEVDVIFFKSCSSWFLFNEIHYSMKIQFEQVEGFVKYYRFSSFCQTDVIQIDDKNEEEDLCTICQEELKVAKLLPCGHKFHLKCLFNWVKNQPKPICPNCRQEIQPLLQQNNQPKSFFKKLFKKSLEYLIIFIRIIALQPVVIQEQNVNLAANNVLDNIDDELFII